MSQAIVSRETDSERFDCSEAWSDDVLEEHRVARVIDEASARGIEPAFLLAWDAEINQEQRHA